MKRRILCAAAIFLFCSFCSAFAQKAESAKKYHDWWNDRWPGEPLKSPDSKKLPLMSVRSNKFVDPQGNTVLFRGVSIGDPDKLVNQGHWNRDFFVQVQRYGARLVRIPVHPVAWRERTPKQYLLLLDQAVAWCTELGMYVDIDWHSIGNLKTGLFQDPMYDTSMEETFQFWHIIARHFAGHNTVAFYELFNEPTSYQNQLGPARWEEWKGTNEDLIAVIRAFDAEKIPLVAGFDWAYDLTPLHESPIQAEGVAYVTHPYPWKRSKPWEPKWDEDFGFAAGRYPVVATEIGFEPAPGANSEGADYGAAITKYLESRGMSWVAWVFDPEWGPSLIKSWDAYALTAEGEAFKQAMQAAPTK